MKANLTETNDKNGLAWSIIFQIELNEKNILNRAEGLGAGYDERIISVNLPDDSVLQVILYISSQLQYIDSTILPFDWYHEHCIRGLKSFVYQKSILTLYAASKSKRT